MTGFQDSYCSLKTSKYQLTISQNMLYKWWLWNIKYYIIKNHVHELDTSRLGGTFKGSET